MKLVFQEVKENNVLQEVTGQNKKLSNGLLKKINLNNEGDIEIHLVMVDPSILETDKFEKRWSEILKDRIAKTGEEYEPRPTIFYIKGFPISSLLEERKLAPNASFLESNIWNYLADSSDAVNDALKSILSHQELYSTDVAREFIEYQTRILGESYLYESGGHAKYVLPFISHSEKKAKEDFESIRSGKVLSHNPKWRMLLVDDYSDIPLKSNNGAIEKTKKGIIEDILELPNKQKINNNLNIKISRLTEEDKKLLKRYIALEKTEQEIIKNYNNKPEAVKILQNLFITEDKDSLDYVNLNKKHRIVIDKILSLEKILRNNISETIKEILKLSDISLKPDDLNLVEKVLANIPKDSEQLTKDDVIIAIQVLLKEIKQIKFKEFIYNCEILINHVNKKNNTKELKDILQLESTKQKFILKTINQLQEISKDHTKFNWYRLNKKSNIAIKETVKEFCCLFGLSENLIKILFNNEAFYLGLYKSIIKYKHVNKNILTEIIFKGDFIAIINDEDFPKYIENNTFDQSNNINKKDKNCDIIIETINAAELVDEREKAEEAKDVERLKEIEDELKDKIIWRTLERLSTETYDVILLDYLLGTRSGKYADRREYSYRLLKVINCICEDKVGFTENNITELRKYAPKGEGKDEIKENEIKEIISGIKKHKGPLGHFWIFNISTFQTAFQDRMREQGLGHSSEHWMLSRGADPVNTPELFKHTLYRFIRLQFKRLIPSTEDLITFIINNPIERLDNIPNADKWASSIFGEFMHKFYAKEIINRDKSNGSLFASSVLTILKESEEIKKTTNLTEHFRHLLYTLAFDSGLKMQIAWEELQLIKRKITDLEKNRLHKTIFELELYISETLNKFN